MFGTCNPSDGVVRVELDPSASLFLSNNLKAVVVDEHVGRAALELIGGNSLLNRLHRRGNDSGQTFLVHRTLDGDVRQYTILQSWRTSRGIILRVHMHLTNRTDALGDTSNNDLSKELAYPCQRLSKVSSGARDRGTY